MARQPLMTLTPQSGHEREEYFLAESRRCLQVWVLRLGGGLANWTEDGSTVVPVWASHAEAAACAVGPLRGYEPEAWSLHRFREQVLRMLAEREVWVAVHPDPTLAGNRMPASRLAMALREECT